MTLASEKRVYNLLSREALLNPYPLYEKLRTEAPVYYFEEGGFWFLSRYQDVEAAVCDLRLSSDKRALYASKLLNLDKDAIKNIMKLLGGMMVDKDPPEHTRMRKVSLSGFTTRALEGWREIIHETTNSLLDKVQARGCMDVVQDLSLPLPSLMIAKIMGVPEHQRAEFQQWAIDIATFWGAPNGEEVVELALRADKSAVLFTEYINHMIEERKRNKTDDMISLLVTAYEENGFNLDELPSLCILILCAGLVTTADLIPNGINALLTNPEQLDKLKSSPQLVGYAVEEMMRFDPPVPIIFRIAKEDVTISGKTIPQGHIVAIGLGAANRDPQKFDSPDVFDITRTNNEHLGFSKGIHFCLGAVLARMELTICFETLLRRMPNISFDANNQPISKRQTIAFKGFKSFPVKF
ncbi:biotin biosynthesis cytochrome P450 [Dulcicalothrix desertica PCC 7102]|uniref:Biotin biosynthesis cytochrome P450 n=1 Tax=Dulcicalothrix desertica PCC 7102 TaxID=232991 RepID=A0A433V7F9_9CYAN|nr:cytochrome P450 [Dulcicalothrix desertica]RUT02052.1 biotin biosynthesis cytochrome P450 [Dulcicalothrix desertica PCC 7102]TWH53699.1 cytochrome P450 PksS [Dulcicalothrix desertica PCC 7102]